MQRTEAVIGDLTFDVMVDGPPDGEPVFLLHGFPQTPAAWEGIQPLLAAEGFRTLAPFLRGYSPNARPPEVAAYATTELAHDVLAIADVMALDEFHVVGHDWGGVLAWLLAATPAKGVRTITSLSTPHPAAMAGALWRSTQLARSSYIALFRLPAVPERLLLAGDGAVLRRMLTTSGLDERHAALYADAMSHSGALSAALNWYRAAPAALGRTPPSSVPTLHVWSSGDVALGRAAAEQTARHVDASYRFEVLDGVSHWIPEEAPERVASLILEHLRMD